LAGVAVGRAAERREVISFMVGKIGFVASSGESVSGVLLPVLTLYYKVLYIDETKTGPCL
jgi:hypothetical protein